MGRNGMHQYNNMDTAMISAINAIKPFIEQEEINDAAILKNIIKPMEKFKQESA